MTLMDAQKFDEARARRRRNLIIVGIVVALILVWVVYHLRDYPDRHAVNKFFAALEHQNLDEAYAIWYRIQIGSSIPQNIPIIP